MEMCTAELRYETILPLVWKSRGASAVSGRRSSNAVIANSPLLKSCWRALASTFESPAPETAELPHFGEWPLKAQLLETVLLLETERIAAVIGLILVENPTFAAELSRRADASEFTPIMRAIQSGR